MPFLLSMLLMLLFGSAGVAAALNLDEALVLARQAHPGLVAERHRLEQAAQELRQTRSGYWPTLEARAGYTAQAEAQAVIVGGREQPTQERSYPFWSLSAEQMLYDFGRTAGKVRRADALSAVVAAEVAVREQDALLLVVTAYCQVLAQQQLVTAAREEVEQVSDHRRIAASLFEQGVVTRNDLLQAEVRLAGSRQAQLAQENALENAWLQLNYLLGRSPETRDALVPPAPVAERPLDPLARPEMTAARARAEGAAAEVVQARSRFLPQLYLRGEANYLENSYAREQTIYAATAGLRLNLFDGFASSAQLLRADSSRREAASRVTDINRRALLEDAAARNDLHAATERLQVLQAAILAGEENLRINRERYRLQTGTATEVLDAQTLLTRTRSDYWLAYFDQQVAWARVRRAAGNL